LEELKKPLEIDKSQNISDTFMVLQALQQKWDLHASVVEAFKDLMESGRDEHKIALEKTFIADDIWLKASKMQDVCIRHK